MASYGINDTSNSNGYTLPNLPNNLQNTYTGNSVTENLGTGNIQTPGTNHLQNPYNNFNNKQSLPRVNTPINGVSSIPTPKTNNVLPKMTPYPGQTPIQSTFTTPNANTRNSNLQQYNQLQKPNQLPEELTDWLNKNDYAYP